MDKKTIKARHRAIRAQMRAKGVDCLIATSTENVSYATAFSGHDSWMVSLGNTVRLFTDSRYTEQAKKECVACRVIEHPRDLIKTVAAAINRARSVRIVGVDSTCTVAVFNRLKKQLNARLKPVAGAIEAVRRAKDAAEVRLIRKAAQVAWQGLSITLGQLRIGMTEAAAAGMLDYQMRKLGCMTGFDTIIAFGANGSRNHHQPGTKKLRKNDTILIDFGAKYKGYISDVTRSFAVGRINPLYEKAYYAVLQAQQAAIRAIKPGVELVEIDAIARETIAGQDLPVYGHGTGHGLGMQVHEAPLISAGSKGKLQAGDVVTVEPGIYMPGKLGIRIEDDVLVTKTGHTILSKDTRFGFSKPKLPVLKIK